MVVRFAGWDGSLRCHLHAVDPTWADVNAVRGQPEGAATLSLLPLLVAQFVAGEDVGAYEGGVLAAEEGEAGMLGRLVA